MDSSELDTGTRRDAVAWSIGRLIELLDQAIDSAGAQLARSAGLWEDSPSPFDESDRPARRRRSQPSESRDLLEQIGTDHERGLV